MDISDFKDRVKNLIPVRKEALENGEQQKVTLFSGKFYDLFSLYQGKWHYITTIKK